ncbi:MAG: hypothetical protein ACE5GW_04555 [Planctomycetota bacterium]
MEKGRVLIVGCDKDSAYAIRNVFELEHIELELALMLEVAKSVLLERHIDLIIIDARLCLQDDFDLIDFQLDHGLQVPMILVGGESTGVRRKVRSRRGVKVHALPADGIRLLEFVRGWAPVIAE